jgi:uncharacterized protein YsxB (DUF464 family)
MKNALQAEQLGAEHTIELLNHFLKCKNQREACPEIHSFLLALRNERGHKRRSAVCSGVTTMLLVGLETIKREARSNER